MILILMILIPFIYPLLENSRFLGKVANGVVLSSFSPLILLIKFGALQNRAKLDTQLSNKVFFRY